MSKLSLEARRWRMIIVSVPIMAATSLVLYKRLVLGEPQRTLPRGDDAEAGKHRVLDFKPERKTPGDSGEGAEAQTNWGR